MSDCLTKFHVYIVVSEIYVKLAEAAVTGLPKDFPELISAEVDSYFHLEADQLRQAATEVFVRRRRQGSSGWD